MTTDDGVPRAMATADKPASFTERLRVLEGLCAFLRPRLRGRLTVGRANPGEHPPTFAVARLHSNDEPLVSFGLVDTIFFWTFDGGTSCHYSRDKDLMTRTIAMELARSQHLSHPT